MHISVPGMSAVVLILQDFLDRLLRVKVALMLNNSTVVSHISKQGGTVCLIPCSLGEEVVGSVEANFLIPQGLVHYWEGYLGRPVESQRKGHCNTMITISQNLKKDFSPVGHSHGHDVHSQRQEDTSHLCFFFEIPLTGRKMPSSILRVT